jgi:hypothetical protein
VICILHFFFPPAFDIFVQNYLQKWYGKTESPAKTVTHKKGIVVIGCFKVAKELPGTAFNPGCIKKEIPG